MLRANRTLPFGFIREYVTRWDVVALVVVLGLVALLAEASRGLLAPLSQLDTTPLSLSIGRLPEYAARTTLRMFAALGLSLVFTLTYATWAARSPRAARVLVPLLDILQSVPILGFISVTVVFFMSLAPGRVLGAEFAAIFAIFTSQAWNMAFSFYQSLRTVPAELAEAATSFHLTPWMRFWQLDVPFALPALCWNMMMSMSGGWFFVVASESISVGHTSVALPGIGSYIALAIEQRNLTRHRLGHRHHGAGHPALRPAAVPPADRLGGPVPGRTGSRRGAAAVLGADHAAALAPDPGVDGGVPRRGALDQLETAGARAEAHGAASGQRSALAPVGRGSGWWWYWRRASWAAPPRPHGARAYEPGGTARGRHSSAC